MTKVLNQIEKPGRRSAYEVAFALLLSMVWTSHTLVTYFEAVLLRLPYVHAIRDHIMTFIFAVLAIFSLPYMVRRVSPMLVLSYVGISSIYLLNIVIYPKNAEALRQNMIPFLIKALPLVFVGVSIDLKKHHHLLYCLSLGSVICKFIQLLIEPSNVTGGDMYSSYLLLPHVCMVMVAMLTKANFTNITVSILGAVAILAFGSRGSLLCLLVLIILYLLVFAKFHRRAWLIGFLIAVVLCIAVFYEAIMPFLISLIQRLGMSARILGMSLTGDILYSSGRDVIQAKLLDALSDNWFGYGIAGDRAIAGTYSHNILIEFWISYGVFIGTALFTLLMAVVVKVLVRKSKSDAVEDRFIIVLISSGLAKLFMSGSYLTEGLLFLLLGVVYTEVRKWRHGPQEEPVSDG